MCDDISVLFFSSARSSFRDVMCGFNPLLKLCVQTIALAMVRRINMMVMTAKNVRDRRAGR